MDDLEARFRRIEDAQRRLSADTRAVGAALSAVLIEATVGMPNRRELFERVLARLQPAPGVLDRAEPATVETLLVVETSLLEFEHHLRVVLNHDLDARGE